MRGIVPEALVTLVTDPADALDQATAIGIGGVTDYLLDFAQSAIPRVASIALIILIAFVILRVLRSTVKNFVRKALERRDQAPRDVTQKAQTLASVIESTGRFIIMVVASMMVLTNLGLDIAPLIASAGIAGLAIAFGAQSLIKDMLNGFLILFENHYSVGDYVTIDPVSGTVEELTLRRTVLRAIDGTAIVVPNGDVRIVQNLSKGWSRALVDINLSPEADDDTVMAILSEVFDNIHEDEELGPRIIEPATIIGLSAVSINQITYRVMIKTLPMEQWSIQRALQRRVRKRLIAAGVPLPGTVPGALAEMVESQGP